MSDDRPALTAAWYREGTAATIDGETAWPDATGNRQTLFGVDIAQGSDQQAFTAIESTLDNRTTWGEAKPMTLADLKAAYEKLRDAPPPAWKPRMILVSPQEAAALARLRAFGATQDRWERARQLQNDPSDIAEIDTSVVYEPQQYPSVVGRWTVTREQATRYPLPAPWHPDEGEQYAAGFWLPYCASDEEASQHVTDFYWTKITPGANPREEWAKGDAPSDSAAFEALDDAGYSAARRDQLRKMSRALRRVGSHRNSLRRSVFEMDSDLGGMTWAMEMYRTPSTPGYTYVPRDVCRWRDPAHRAELTRRAREYAECTQRLVDR